MMSKLRIGLIQTGDYKIELMSTLSEQLLAYLQKSVESLNSINRNFLGKYKSNEALVLDYGIIFNKQIKPSSIKGKPSLYYQNCYEIMCDNPDLHYCEGFAVHEKLPLPLTHAWLINNESEVIDPTWLDRGETAYLGVVFNKSFITKRLIQTQSFAVIESDYKQDYKMLKNGFTAEMLNQKFHQL